MKENNITAQLKDIKPLLEIPDISYYIYWSLIALGILIGLSILFFIVKKLLSLRKVNVYKGYLESLKALQMTNPKEFAYLCTLYARQLSDRDEEIKALFVPLKENLIQYKYRKVVSDIDEESKKMLAKYIEVADGKV